MEKLELLQQIKNFATQKLISKREILDAYNQGTGNLEGTTTNSKFAKVLYGIGGAIVFIGIVIMVGQNWRNLSDIARILITFGSGIAAYIMGVLFIINKKLGEVNQAFFLISALVLPLGLYVVFDVAGIDISTFGYQSIISAILFVVFLLSFIIFKKNIFVLFSIIFGTWLFFSLTSFLVSNNPAFRDFKFYEYRALLVGLAYILLGYSFSKGSRVSLSGSLYGFGSMIFLGSALALGGYSSKIFTFWELIFPGLVFGILYLSTRLRSKTFLVFGTIFLMIYILKITAEHFSEGLGWPLSLILAGLALIGAGYLAFVLNKKFVSRNNELPNLS